MNHIMKKDMENAMQNSKNMSDLNIAFYTVLSELSFQMCGRPGSETMALTALVASMAILTQCGYTGDKMKSHIITQIDEYNRVKVDDLING